MWLQLDFVVFLLILRIGNPAFAVTVSEMIIKTGSESTNAGVKAEICDGAGKL